MNTSRITQYTRTPLNIRLAKHHSAQGQRCCRTPALHVINVANSSNMTSFTVTPPGDENLWNDVLEIPTVRDQLVPRYFFSLLYLHSLYIHIHTHALSYKTNALAKQIPILSDHHPSSPPTTLAVALFPTTTEWPSLPFALPPPLLPAQPAWPWTATQIAC